jgi:dienelactone hydrolase
MNQPDQRRENVLAGMQQVMGPLPGNERRVPPDVRIVAESRFGQSIRQKISFAVEAGDRVPAWLFLPTPAGKPVPAILCLHQTTPAGKDEPAGLAGDADLHYASELAEKGFVVLAPDYPNFGEYQVDPYRLGYLSATMKAIWNHMRAVDVLQSLPQVEPSQIGAIGHSLGGHNTIFLAAFDTRVRASVSSCGFNSFKKYKGGDLTGWSHAGYMPRIAKVYGCDPARMPFDFPEVTAALAPRGLFINAPLNDDNFEVSGVRECVETALPVFQFHKAEQWLVAEYPDTGHRFPADVRRRAYDFLGRCLRDRKL